MGVGPFALIVAVPVLVLVYSWMRGYSFPFKLMTSIFVSVVSGLIVAWIQRVLGWG